MLSKTSFIFIFALLTASGLSLFEEEMRAVAAKRKENLAIDMESGEVDQFYYLKDSFDIYKITRKETVYEFMSEVPIHSVETAREDANVWFSAKINEIMASRFGDLDEIEKKMIEKYSSKDSNGQQVAQKFSDLERTPDLRNDVANAFFVNVEAIDGDIYSLDYIENTVLLMIKSSMVNIMPTVNRDAFNAYRNVLNSKVSDFVKRFRFNVPQEIAVKLPNYSEIQNQLDKNLTAFLKEGLNPISSLLEIYAEAQYWILQILSGNEEAIKSIDKKQSLIIELIQTMSVENIFPLNLREKFITQLSQNLNSWSRQAFDAHKLTNEVYKTIVVIEASLVEAQIAFQLPEVDILNQLKAFVNLKYRPTADKHFPEILSSVDANAIKNFESKDISLEQKLIYLDLIAFDSFSAIFNKYKLQSSHEWRSIFAEKLLMVLDYDFEIAHTYAQTKQLFSNTFLNFEQNPQLMKDLYLIINKMSGDQKKNIVGNWQIALDNYLDAKLKNDSTSKSESSSQNYFLFKLLNLITLNGAIDTEVEISTLNKNVVNHSAEILKNESSTIFAFIVRTIHSSIYPGRITSGLSLNELIADFSGKTLKTSWFNFIKKFEQDQKSTLLVI
jgi:hypothetical protein